MHEIHEGFLNELLKIGSTCYNETTFLAWCFKTGICDYITAKATWAWYNN